MAHGVNNQDQNMQKITGGIGKPSDINKPQVNATVHGSLGKRTHPNSQTNNLQPSTMMKKKMSPNSQKQDNFPTMVPGGKVQGSKVGMSGSSNANLFGRAKLTVTQKLPANTAPNNQQAAKFREI